MFSTANDHLKPKTFDIYAEIIKAKGDNVVDTFFLLTFFKNPQKARQKTLELLTSRALLTR